MTEKILNDLNLSSEEMGRFAKAMKDAQFRELLNEYAREISEPMNKEEADNYVKMVEERSESKKLSMKGKELVIPTPDFCFKTKNKNTGSKFFINVCHSDKLAQPQSDERADGSGAEWHIAYSLSPIHTDKDKGWIAISSALKIQRNLKKFCYVSACRKWLLQMSANEVELDISDTQALLKVPGLYRLQVKWRFLVDSTKGFARFDKTNHKLEVTVPTCVASASPM